MLAADDEGASAEARTTGTGNSNGGGWNLNQDRLPFSGVDHEIHVCSFQREKSEKKMKCLVFTSFNRPGKQVGLPQPLQRRISSISILEWNMKLRILSDVLS